jgi:hypothetical protein
VHGVCAVPLYGTLDGQVNVTEDVAISIISVADAVRGVVT